MKASKFNALREGALRVLANAPADLAKWGTDVNALLEELSVYQIELEHQVDEARRAQEDMVTAKEAWEDLFENAPLAYVILDASMNITRVNAPFRKLFFAPSYDMTDGVLLPFSRFVHTTYQDAFYRFTRLLSAASTSAQTDLLMINRYGVPLPVKVNAVSNLATRVYRFAISDMTIQKRLEAELRQELELTRKMKEATHEGEE